MLTINTSKHICFSFLSKIFQISAQCYSLAIITKAFDKQDTGIWLLFFHSIFFFSFFDIGLGGTFLQSRLCSFSTYEKTKKAAFFFEKFIQALCLYLIGFVGLALFSSSLVQKFFTNIKYDSSQVQNTFLIFAFFQLLRFPLNFWGAALMSCEKGYVKSILEILENLGLILLASCLFYLKVALFQSLITCGIYSCFVALLFFLFSMIYLRWDGTNLSFSSLVCNPFITLKSSLPFWLQNIFSTFLFSVSPFVFNSSLGMHFGSNYVLSFKICSLVVGIHLAFLAPLLPFYRILHETNQQAQAIKKLIKSLGFSLVFLLGMSLLIYIFIEPLLKFWTSREVVFYFNLLPWMLLYGLINVFSIYLNSLEKVTWQNICLILGLGIFTALTSFFKHSEDLFCLASWICLLPLLISNILEVVRLSRSARYIQENSNDILS